MRNEFALPLRRRVSQPMKIVVAKYAGRIAIPSDTRNEVDISGAHPSGRGT
ncbi:MAG TPA: hypothetical protein VFA99_11690 [Acidobacteriaceae bacterium]|nr:hypothetical protein [Acidobacteriaceae bacterium]